LEEPIEVAAYFVASEALANAAKHSAASRIDVSLAQRDGSLVLSVRDDGVGGAMLRAASAWWGSRIASRRLAARSTSTAGRGRERRSPRSSRSNWSRRRSGRTLNPPSRHSL